MIVSIREMKGRSGGMDVKRKGDRRARFRVKTNSPFHAPQSIYDSTVTINGVRIPAYYAADPEGGGRCVLKKSADQDDDNPCYWVVNVEYGVPDGAEDGSDSPDPDNPVTRRPIWVRSSWKYTKNVFKDKDGNAILNSAGDPFSEGLDLEIGGRLWRYTVWKPTDGDSLWDTHLLHTNSVEWKGKTAGTCLCSDLQSVEERVNGIIYYKHDYEVMHKADGWEELFLNRGFREKIAGGKLKHIVDDATGKEIKEPWFLDVNTGAAIRPQAPSFKSFAVRGSATFSTLW